MLASLDSEWCLLIKESLARFQCYEEVEVQILQSKRPSGQNGTIVAYNCLNKVGRCKKSKTERIDTFFKKGKTNKPLLNMHISKMHSHFRSVTFGHHLRHAKSAENRIKGKVSQQVINWFYCAVNTNVKGYLNLRIIWHRPN